MGRVTGKVAIVTGAAQGLGFASAALLAREGASVVIADVNEAKGQEAAARIGGATVFEPLDVTDADRWTELVDATVARFGQLDILVNCAGISITANVEETTPEMWRRAIAVNLDGTFYGTQQAIRVMKERRQGSIINFSSIDGTIGEADLAAYCAAKGGVRTFTKAVAVHCGEQGYRIRANSVHPGYIRTPMHEAYLREMGVDDAPVVARHPIGRLGEPDDVAYAVLYLASDESSFVTGIELPVDGGYLAR